MKTQAVVLEFIEVYAAPKSSGRDTSSVEREFMQANSAVLLNKAA